MRLGGCIPRDGSVRMASRPMVDREIPSLSRFREERGKIGGKIGCAYLQSMWLDRNGLAREEKSVELWSIDAVFVLFFFWLGQALSFHLRCLWREIIFEDILYHVGFRSVPQVIIGWHA